MIALPIDPFIPEIVARVRERRALVIVAAPGAGKTTRVPPALAADGPALVLQPRRIAARSLAARIATEQGWTIGGEVGWHVRFERQFGPRTQVLLATEGILTARLQQDPLLSGFRTIILDEFHERSLHADLGIALAKQAWLARDDLRLVVMSATLDAQQVSRYLSDCPVLDIPGTLHPIDVRYAPGVSLSDAVATGLREHTGQVLCFLPGAGEIARARRELSMSVDVVELHGSMDASAQDAALAAVPHRRVILATNIAETSLTVPGVGVVVDTGLHKVSRYDPDRGIDSLDTARISTDAADQRAGRAGRLGPGLAMRLWHAADRLRPHREPEVHRVDLSGTVLEILGWGGDPRTFDWFDAPSDDRLDAAFELLDRLGATRMGALLDLGRRMQRLPLSPRLAAILLAGNGARSVALACALLAERHTPPPARSAERRAATTSSDLLAAIDDERQLPPHVTRTAAQLQAVMGSPTARALDEGAFRRALLAGYPDRVGRRRAPGSPKVLLASGHGAAIGPESGVHDGEWLVALDVSGARRGEVAEARIRIASLIEREWLTPTATSVEHALDADRGVVRATERTWYGAVVLGERPATPDPVEVARLLTDAFLAAPLGTADEQIVRRLRFAGMDLDRAQLAARAAAGARSLADVTLARALTGNERATLDRAAPDVISVPSGRTAYLEYQEDGSVTAAVKLQELFGLGDTPRIGPRREPVLLALLAPNGRPVQMTRDLRSFWERTYPEVRKELRGRYPKHPWPEDPWSAPPTARTVRRR